MTHSQSVNLSLNLLIDLICVKTVYVNEIGVSNFTKLMQLNRKKTRGGAFIPVFSDIVYHSIIRKIVKYSLGQTVSSSVIKEVFSMTASNELPYSQL